MDEILDLVVVLVTYDSAEVLEGFLESLPAACGELRWKLAVADNASGDGSLDIVRSRFPEAVTVSTGGNVGYAAAINAAVAAAPASELLLVTNPDVRAPVGSVADLVERLEPGVGVLGPRIIGESGELALSIHRAPTVARALSDSLLGGERVRRWRGEVVNDPAEYERAADVDWLSGAFLVIPRRCHDQLRGWDPRFFLYSEETDFALRAGDAGWRVRFDPVCTIAHVGGDSDRSPWLYTILTVNRIRLVALRRGRVYGAGYAVAVLVGELLRSVRSREVSVHRTAARALLFPRRRPAQVRQRLSART